MNTILIPLFAATNDVATTVAEPTAFPRSFWGIPWWGLGITAVAVVAAAAVVKHIKASPSAEKLDKEELLNDILAAIAKNEPNCDALRTELAAGIDGTAKLTSPVLAAILRIEESFEKLPSGKYRRRVSILRRKNGSSAGVLTKVESEISWEYIPEAVREESIKTRQDKIARLIYEAGEGVA